MPTLIVARTDALAANLLTSDVDEQDARFATGERTAEGFYRVEPGMAPVIARGLAYAPYADLIWVETGTPDLAQAREFAEALHAQYPDKMLAYNCSPSFNWKAALDDDQIAKFQRELGAMGYRFQFITLAGFHSLNHGMFDLARGYAEHGMTAYVDLQEREFAAQSQGFTAVKHQREVGTGYFDLVSTASQPRLHHHRPHRLHGGTAVPLDPTHTPPDRRAAPPEHPAPGAGATPPAPAISSPAGV